ncbi:MAG: hypothetical protein R3F60_06930 [bacterium]
MRVKGCGLLAALVVGLLGGCDDAGGGQPGDASVTPDAQGPEAGRPDARVADGGPDDARVQDALPPEEDAARPDGGELPDASAPAVVGSTPAVVSGGARRATDRFQLTLTVGGPAPMADRTGSRFRLHLGVVAPTSEE